MKEIATIGLDLAKNVFQVHGIDAKGIVLMRRQVRRAQVLLFFSRLPPCLVGMEACAGAHYWYGNWLTLTMICGWSRPTTSSGARRMRLMQRRSAKR